jgi:prepilin-type N-terminal cleavage/methylation domain-containing protein
MRRLLRQGLRGQAGHTLTELITALAIMSIVLGGLGTMFRAGMRAEVKANREVQAQQNARLALDRLRQELHCANEISAANGVAVSSISVTLPAVCRGADTTVTYTATSVATGRWKLTRTGDSSALSTVADHLSSATPFTYWAPASGTLGRLSVDIPVNVNPTDTSTQWRLQDDIVLRNTSRL